ncbi:hypothetical protein PGH07_07790 [Sulfurovum sp. zt1-1]|uniref:PPIase n=1 Tax=Sulfurovum zhangzhouensis TaxID=3019067 RepID=A0ABT7QZ24_9BACT|nr:hypothetical protein [Sulfurovum zhangzhouensis]MDM5272078.1 hypothetical protein [Sulfurovum zhangzhouensis]
MRNFSLAIPLDITIDLPKGESETFSIEVQTLTEEMQHRYDAEVKKRFNVDSVSKERAKKLKKERQKLSRYESQLEDIVSEIELVSPESKDKKLDLLSQKRSLQDKVWKIEDAIEKMHENDPVDSDRIKKDTEAVMKELYDLAVIDDGGLSEFMKDRSIKYADMVPYILQKREEAQGNA